MLLLKCPDGGCQKTFLACLYCCRDAMKKKCSSYNLLFDEIKSQEIEEKYLDKYGLPVYTIPLARRKRRKRKVVQEENQLIQAEEEE